jgi:hypothetical protein
VIETKYIQGEEVPIFDDRISAAISHYGIDGGGNEMRIAVENFDKKVYRVITSVGLGAYIHATSSLLDLGMRDVLEKSVNVKSGYDSWFVATPEMMQESIDARESGDESAASLLSDLEVISSLPETERTSLALSRIGQGEFRHQLIAYWSGCAVTGANCTPLLKASHIKPWRVSNNVERLDVFNGLLLVPNIDTAFDRGYITFGTHGKVMISREISGASAFQLHINTKLRLNQKLLRPEHEIYLEYHRREVFRG